MGVVVETDPCRTSPVSHKLGNRRAVEIVGCEPHGDMDLKAQVYIETTIPSFYFEVRQQAEMVAE